MQEALRRDEAYLQQVNCRKAAAVAQNIKPVDGLHRVVRVDAGLNQLLQKRAGGDCLVPCLLTRAHAVAQQKIVPLARAEACAIVAGDIGTAQSRRAEAELGGVLVRLSLCLRGLGKILQEP